MDRKVTEWLLDEKYPAVRYYAMKNLRLGKEQEIAAAKAEVMNDPAIQKIISNQNEDGSFREPERFYKDKYHGTVWQLLILAELGADGKDPQIKKACEFILDHSQDKTSYGFSVDMGKDKCGLPGMVIPCLTGNMVYSLIRLGYLEDERVQNAIRWIVRYQRADDGERKSDSEERYASRVACFKKHSCFMGVVKGLKALAVIPDEKREEQVNRKVKELSEFMLIHHLYKKSHDLSVVAKEGWTRFGFPLMYQTDVLEIADILTDLKCHDERMREGYQLIEKKQKSDGCWELQNTYNGKMIVSIEKKNEPSRWITAKALKVLDRKELQERQNNDRI